MTKQTLIIIIVTDDDETRDWWTALGLPAPERWDADLPASVHASLELEKEIR